MASQRVTKNPRLQPVEKEFLPKLSQSVSGEFNSSLKKERVSPLKLSQPSIPTQPQITLHRTKNGNQYQYASQPQIKNIQSNFPLNAKSDRIYGVKQNKKEDAPYDILFNPILQNKSNSQKHRLPQPRDPSLNQSVKIRKATNAYA